METGGCMLTLAPECLQTLALERIISLWRIQSTATLPGICFQGHPPYMSFFPSVRP